MTEDRKVKHLIGIDEMLDELDAKARRNKRRQWTAEYKELQAKHEWRYLREGREADGCVYCGHKSTVWDHVPPLAALESDEDFTKLRMWRSCGTCNDMLQDYTAINIKARQEYVLNCYQARYYEAWKKIQSIKKRLNRG